MSFVMVQPLVSNRAAWTRRRVAPEPVSTAPIYPQLCVLDLADAAFSAIWNDYDAGLRWVRALAGSHHGAVSDLAARTGEKSMAGPI
eukprot:915040-Pyramimonas_sp.AAC.1